MKRLATLISGGGTTMAAILEACGSDGPLYGLVDPVLIVASNKDAGGIAKAEAAGMERMKNLFICDPRSFASRENFGLALLDLLDRFKPDIVGQYGWLPRTPDCVIKTYQGRLFNQHNNPLDPGRPHFGGKRWFGRRNICARLLYVRETGDPEDRFTEATIHRVVKGEMDSGEVIGRARVDILPGDDVYSLQQRLLPVEHRLQIEVLELLSRGTAVPLHREKPLVPDDRIGLLEESIRIATLLFPNG